MRMPTSWKLFYCQVSEMGNGSPPSCRRAIHQEPRPQCLISPARQFHLPPDEMTRRDLALVVLRLKPACHWPTRNFLYTSFFSLMQQRPIKSNLHCTSSRFTLWCSMAAVKKASWGAGFSSVAEALVFACLCFAITWTKNNFAIVAPTQPCWRKGQGLFSCPPRVRNTFVPPGQKPYV